MFLGLCIKSMSSTYTKTYKKINYKNCLHLISAKKNNKLSSRKMILLFSAIKKGMRVNNKYMCFLHIDIFTLESLAYV